MVNGKIGLAKVVSCTMLGSGTVAILTSILYTSMILAFIGLGLTFWGAILLYIQNAEYVQKALLDASVLPSLIILNQLVQELNCKGNAVYLPPKYFEDPENTKIYISKQESAGLPAPDLIQKCENQLFTKNPEGILLTPPGAALTKLFEKTLETSFTKVDLKYLQTKLPKLFVEDLEIAENLEFQVKGDTIQVKMASSLSNPMFREASRLPHVFEKIGFPIFSAIACALTKATGKPVLIEGIQPPENGRIVEATYRVLEIKETQEKPGMFPTQVPEVKRIYPSPLSNLTSLFLIVSGLAIPAWVGWLTWYDMTTWGKDLSLIFFGPRMGEAISLGIGMRVIYYFLVGLASLLLGLLMFIRKRHASPKGKN